MSAGPQDILPDRVQSFYDMVRNMSRQRDPESLLRAYRERAHFVVPFDHVLSVSRKGLAAPRFRITRFSGWPEPIDPWREPQRLPLLEGGWLGEMLYAGRPQRIDRLSLPPGDPANGYFDGMQSVLMSPVFDDGEPHYMVFLMRQAPAAYSDDELATAILTSNLIGRVNGQIILAEKLRSAYVSLDRELEVVADLQRSMLPGKLPTIAGIELAAHYQTSARAGGDYYGIFELPHERWGLLLADISGHGAPAAVVTAMLHTILRTEDVPLEDCVRLMRHLNQRLLGLVPRNTFATAFYTVLSPDSLNLRYATAGHDPPRVRRAGSRRIEELELGTGLPLAISAGAQFIEQPARLAHGDQLVLYTDGITEAFAPDGEMFGVNRLDAALLAAHGHAPDTARTVIHNVDEFTHGAPPHDDRTLLVLAAEK